MLITHGQGGEVPNFCKHVRFLHLSSHVALQSKTGRLEGKLQGDFWENPPLDEVHQLIKNQLYQI